MRLFVGIGLALSAVLALGAGGAFWYASTMLKSATPGDQVTVTIAANNCQPDQLTVPEGRTTFRIVNATDRAVEWEILDGVMVLEERENIAPGFAQTLTARLDPGSYDITCGLISNPRGRLMVTPAGGPVSKPNLTAFIGALAEYKVFLASGAMDLASAADDLSAALKTGDQSAARQAISLARTAYEQMSANITSDAVISDLNALAAGASTPDPALAARLVSESADLAGAIRTVRLTPERMLAGATGLLTRLNAPTPGITGTPAPLEAEAVLARAAGITKITGLLAPLAAKVDPELPGQINRDSAALTAALGAMKQPVAQWSAAERSSIETLAQTLGADLGRLAEKLGLN